MTSLLHVWLRGEHMAELERLRNATVRLRYDEAILDRYGLGARPLSLSMPLESRRVSGDALDAFLEGLLPEGQVREDLTREYRARTAFDLLAHIGLECAGAVQFTASEEPPSAGELVALTDAEVNEMVVALPTLTPPEGQPLTASLGGIQAKILLAKTASGWAWPAGGAMSSHLIKPQASSTGGPPHLVHAEHWAMQVAARAGLPAANTELHEFDGRPAIVVERFDRREGRRAHQEDFTQSLGILPASKYESTLRDPSRLRTIAELGSQNATSPRDFRAGLLRQVAFNAMIGNADAHSKNYSLQIDETASYRPAPLYDVAPVFFLGAYRNAGHAVDGQIDLRHISRAHLVAEGVRWGIPEREAERIVDELAVATTTAIADVEPSPEIVDLPERVLARVRSFTPGS